MNKEQRQHNDEHDETIRVLMDYHGMDETACQEECRLTRNQMRAMMVYLAGMGVGHTQTSNRGTCIVKMYHAMSKLNHAIDEENRQVMDDIDPIPGGALR